MVTKGNLVSGEIHIDELFPWEHIPIAMIQECLEFKQKVTILFVRGIK